MTPALASCAANLQGKFGEMYELIWEQNRNFSRDNMEKLAQQLGLDLDRFKADMDGACKQIVQQDQADVTRVGASGTPAFYINGRFLSGAQPIDRFKAVIDEELKLANARIAKGEATVETYYDEFVLKRGRKELAAPAAGARAAAPPGRVPAEAPGVPGTPQPPGPPPPGKTTWSAEHGHWH